MESIADINGYTTRVLRVDLNSERISEEYLDEETLKKYIGGVGLGPSACEVPSWNSMDDPDVPYFATGPLNVPTWGGDLLFITESSHQWSSIITRLG
jgi:aldehyde:ferredoxin oxidoreductase